MSAADAISGSGTPDEVFEYAAECLSRLTVLPDLPALGGRSLADFALGDGFVELLELSDELSYLCEVVSIWQEVCVQQAPNLAGDFRPLVELAAELVLIEGCTYFEDINEALADMGSTCVSTGNAEMDGILCDYATDWLSS